MKNSMSLREDAKQIIAEALQSALPDEAVKKALENADFGSGKLILVSVGKAGWQMAEAAFEILGNRIDAGAVVTKYDHGKGPIGNLRIYEAGHPVPDENSFQATQAVLDMVEGL